MRSFLKNRFSSQHHNSLHWAHVKAGLAERKLRSAALTNNTEGLKKLLDNHVNPNGTDEHQRTALHFAATKGYTDIIGICNIYSYNTDGTNQVFN